MCIRDRSLVDRILIHENPDIEIVFKYRDEYQQTIEYVLGYADELDIAVYRPSLVSYLWNCYCNCLRVRAKVKGNRWKNGWRLSLIHI